MLEAEQNRVFDDWLAVYKGLLFRIVRIYASDPSDREDLFQEICTQVWRSIPGFRGDCAAKTWVYRVAMNAAVVWSKRETRYRQRRRDDGDRQPVLVPVDSSRDERLDWLFRQIAALDEVDRPITLLFLDGFSYGEIASSLGISENNVGVRIHRIKSRLARLWNEDHDGED